MHGGKGSNGTAHRHAFPVLASLLWAIVMVLFEESPDVLHPSLKKSMDEIYRYVLDHPKLVFDEVDPGVDSRILKE